MQNNLCENENYTVPHEKNEGRCSKIGYVPLNSIADSKKLTQFINYIRSLSIDHYFSRRAVQKKNEEI